MAEPVGDGTASATEGCVPPSTETVSVVVVSHNEGEMLRQTVDWFLGSSEPPDEIVVVDDRSTDASTEFLKAGYEGTSLVEADTPLGISRARNLGGQRAKCDVIVFSDAHVMVHDAWRSPLVEALSDPGVGQVAPAVGYLDERPGLGYGFTWTEPSMKMAWISEKPSANADVPFICGCFLAMRRDVFAASGGFDGGLYRWGFEDAELSLRLWLMGYRCQSVPSSLIRHHFRNEFPYQVDQAGVIFNALRMATVHFDQPAMERVVDFFGQDPAFGRAWAMLLDSDTWVRRDHVNGSRTRDLRWFLDRFGISALG
jgi:cellulose synthase/poly-beta-1,6-N-acetylglucosamine synthase-like glycosyltransferase